MLRSWLRWKRFPAALEHTVVFKVFTSRHVQVCGPLTLSQALGMRTVLGDEGMASQKDLEYTIPCPCSVVKRFNPAIHFAKVTSGCPQLRVRKRTVIDGWDTDDTSHSGRLSRFPLIVMKSQSDCTRAHKVPREKVDDNSTNSILPVNLLSDAPNYQRRERTTSPSTSHSRSPLSRPNNIMSTEL